MLPFRRSPQHNSSTSTALDNTSILEYQVKSPLVAGLKDIANIEDQVSRIQDKVEHPALYCTEKDREAGKVLMQNLYDDLRESTQVLIRLEVGKKLEMIHNEVDYFKKMHEEMMSKYKEVEEKLFEFGYILPVHKPLLEVNETPITDNTSFIIDRGTNAADIPMIPPSPILNISLEKDDSVVDAVATFEHDNVLDLVATPEIFRKISKHQSKLGVEHAKAVMQNRDENIFDIPRNEPTRNIQMTLAGPINVERLIPPPLAESPTCIQDFKFSSTPGPMEIRLSERSKENSPISKSKELEGVSTCEPITEDQYKSLPGYLSKNITHMELNTVLIRFKMLSQECHNISRQIGILSEQEMAKEVGSDSKFTLIKLALKKLKRICLVEDKNGFLIC